MKFNYVYVFILFTITSLTAQDFQGIATYKSHRKVDLKMDDENMNSEMQEQILIYAFSFFYFL